MKDRQQGFAAWQEKERVRKNHREAAAEKVKNQRGKHAQVLAQARDNFKRETRSNQHLEASYLAELEKREAKKAVAQAKYAKENKELQKFIEEQVVPMKAKEYGIEGSGAQ
jgi:hypothetical protein